MIFEPRIRELDGGRYLLEFAELDSTQNEARRRRQAGEKLLVGVRADYQRQGRGRRGTVWYAPPRQALLVTYLVREQPKPADSDLLVSMCGAIAVARAIMRLTKVKARLRWPNDVIVNGKKVAGILVERFWVHEGDAPAQRYAALGIGVNVNVVQFPERIVGEATSLKLATARDWSIEAVEAAIRTALWPILDHLQRGHGDYILSLWKPLDATPGLSYKVEGDRDVLVGIAMGVTARGALIVRMPDGREIETMTASHIAARMGSGKQQRRDTGTVA